MSAKQVSGLERLRNSANGNPRYRVYFTDNTVAITSPDAAICHGITNSDMKGFVDVTFTPDGQIADMNPVSS